ncbi:MAG: tetratricopeptide repeat protein, partial [Pseudomonadota bacterium]
DEGLLAEWRPSTGGCRVLVTSRRQDWSVTLGVKGLPLGLLSPIESIELLRKHRPELAHDDPALTGIAETLGYLPLALHLAGSFLERYQHSDVGDPAAYLADLCREDLLDHRSMIQGSHSPTGHEMHVANSFALSLRLMDTEDPTDKLALDLLTRTACFAPGQPMPKELLLGSLGDGTEPDELVREDALSRLLALGLLERDHAGSLILHRLLALFAQRSAADALDAARDAVEAHLSGEARRINNSGLPRPLRGWQGHLRHVAELSEERMSHSSASLWNSLGYHLTTIGDLSGAKAAYERALRIDEAAYGPDHPNVATSINSLGFVLESEGDLSGAKAAYERALRIDEAAYGPDHPNVAIRVNNLGSVLNAEGDLSGAKAAFERALRIDEAAYGPDHPNVANRVNNLGGVLNAEGDLTGAKVAFERALQIDESTLGIDHPKVAIRVNNLGLVLKAEGDLSGAKAAYGRALRIDEAAYGPDHPNVAIRVNNLGEVLSAEGDLSGAKAACERALRIFETSLGPDHPSTQTVRENLQILDSMLTK